TQLTARTGGERTRHHAVRDAAGQHVRERDADEPIEHDLDQRPAVGTLHISQHGSSSCLFARCSAMSESLSSSSSSSARNASISSTSALISSQSGSSGFVSCFASISAVLIMSTALRLSLPLLYARCIESASPASTIVLSCSVTAQPRSLIVFTIRSKPSRLSD